MTVGVPEIFPEVVLKLSPAGSVGSMAHVATGPPELDIVMGVIPVPRVKITVVVDAVSDASGSLIVIAMLKVLVPPEFRAVIV